MLLHVCRVTLNNIWYLFCSVSFQESYSRGEGLKYFFSVRGEFDKNLLSQASFIFPNKLILTNLTDTLTFFVVKISTVCTSLTEYQKIAQVITQFL